MTEILALRSLGKDYEVSSSFVSQPGGNVSAVVILSDLLIPEGLETSLI